MPKHLYLWYTEQMDEIEPVILVAYSWAAVILVHDLNNYDLGNVLVFSVDSQTM